MSVYPDSIRPQWSRVTARLQSKGCQQTGYAILSIRILVGPDGNPAFWCEPELTRLEPAHGLDRILTILQAGVDKT